MSTAELHVGKAGAWTKANGWVGYQGQWVPVGGTGSAVPLDAVPRVFAWTLNDANGMGFRVEWETWMDPAAPPMLDLLYGNQANNRTTYLGLVGTRDAAGRLAVPTPGFVVGAGARQVRFAVNPWTGAARASLTDGATATDIAAGLLLDAAAITDDHTEQP